MSDDFGAHSGLSVLASVLAEFIHSEYDAAEVRIFIRFLAVLQAALKLYD